MSTSESPELRVPEKVQEYEGEHTCHWPQCERKVPPYLWGCKQHWFKLPQHLRSKIWKYYRPGQERDKGISPEYLEAARQAQIWIYENHFKT